MNNAIIIPKADFSDAKVGALNIQKLTVTKAGNGGKRVDNGGLIDATDYAAGNWLPTENCAYSSEIIMPTGAKYLFGKLNTISLTSKFNNYISNDNAVNIDTEPLPVWCFHNSVTNKWSGLTSIMNTLYTKPEILGYKQGLFYNNQYTAFIFEGGIYGVKFGASLTIDRFVVNWVRNDSAVCPEVGLELPELYVGF